MPKDEMQKAEKMEYEIPVHELKGKLDAKESLAILDVREAWEYATAHIEGSKHMPMGEVPCVPTRSLIRRSTLLWFAIMACVL